MVLGFILGVAALWLLVGVLLARIVLHDRYLPEENRVFGAVSMLLGWPFIMIRDCADAARDE